MADSAGERNELCELLRWCHIAEGLAGMPAEAPLELPKVGSRVLGEVRALWHVLTQQAVRVLVRTTLPGGVVMSRDIADTFRQYIADISLDVGLAVVPCLDSGGGYR